MDVIPLRHQSQTSGINNLKNKNHGKETNPKKCKILIRESI